MIKPKIDSVYRLNSLATKNQYQVMQIKVKAKEYRVIFMNTKTGQRGDMDLKTWNQNFRRVGK